MSKYFRFFPDVKHDLTFEGKSVLLTNILKRFKFHESLKKTIGVFYEYDIQDGERPDTIAAKYYGDPGYGWVVLLFNDKYDPIFDWPLFGYDFDQYIKGKYGSLSEAQAQVHEYRQILNQKETQVDGTIKQEKYIVVDQTTYNSLNGAYRKLVNKYEWEIEENERKRKIKILDKKYLPQIRDELQYAVRNVR